MWTMFFMAVFVVLAIFAFLMSKGAEDPDIKIATKVTGWLFIILTVVTLGLASTATVPTKNVGIVTSFGKPTGDVTGAGLVFHKPWESVDDWDASRNTFDRLGDRCLWVSISGGRSCIAVQIEWSAKEDNAPSEWASYKETKINDEDNTRFETFVARRVNPQMDAAITTTFTTFNPLGQLEKGETTVLKAPDLNKEYKAALKTELEQTVGSSVTIDSIAFGTPSYDEPTTKAISAYSQKTLEARNLAVDKTNAVTRKEITEIDAQVDPVARCLSIAEKKDKEPGLCMTSVNSSRPIK